MKQKLVMILLSAALILPSACPAMAAETDIPEEAVSASTEEEAEPNDALEEAGIPEETLDTEEPAAADSEDSAETDPAAPAEIPEEQSAEIPEEQPAEAEEDVAESGAEALEADPDVYSTEETDEETAALAGKEETLEEAWAHTNFVYNSKVQCMQLIDKKTGKIDTAYNGWYHKKGDESKEYYIEEGEAITGLQEFDDGTYLFFDIKNGLISKECIIPVDEDGFSAYDLVDINNVAKCEEYDLSYCDLCYINADGEWDTSANGWKTIKDANGDSEKVYLKDGIAMQGFKTIGGKHYFFDDTLLPKNYYESRGEVCGRMLHAEWFATGTSFLYYAMPNGQLAEGFKTIEGSSYYFWPKTENGHYSRTAATGWFKVNGFSYYALPFVKGKGYETILDDPVAGALVTGFKTIGGKGYYFWPKTENGHYSKTMAKGWFTLNGFKYYADGSGVLATGFKTIDKKKYYFWPKTSGGHYSKTMAKGWFTLNGFKYYADSKGVLASGWKTIGGKKYYFWPKTSGGHYANTMATGKVKIDGKWYTFQKNGVKK